MFIINTLCIVSVSVAQWNVDQLLGSGKVDCTLYPTDKLGLPPEVGPGSGQFVSLSNPDKLILETLNTREDPWFTIYQHCNQQHCLNCLHRKECPGPEKRIRCSRKTAKWNKLATIPRAQLRNKIWNQICEVCVTGVMRNTEGEMPALRMQDAAHPLTLGIIQC